MTVYKSVYAWEAMDRIREGKKIWVLDKREKEVSVLNEWRLGAFLTLTDENRFVLWFEEVYEDEK